MYALVLQIAGSKSVVLDFTLDGFVWSGPVGILKVHIQVNGTTSKPRLELEYAVQIGTHFYSIRTRCQLSK